MCVEYVSHIHVHTYFSKANFDSCIESLFLVVGSLSSQPTEFVLQLLELKILFEGEGGREGVVGRVRK